MMYICHIMNTNSHIERHLSDYLGPLKKVSVLLGQNTNQNAKKYKEQIKNYEISLSTLLHCSTRELSYERHLQDRCLKKIISQFITQACLIITQKMIQNLTADMKAHILAFFQADAVKQHFSRIDHQPGFFQRIKRRESIGEGKFQVMSKIQTLSPDEVHSKFEVLLAADIERSIYNPSSIVAEIHPNLFFQNLQTMTINMQKNNQNLEDNIHQQLSCLDETSYGIYKIIAYNRFFNIGSSLFLATEQASRDERFKKIPGNVPLDPSFVNFFSTLMGLLYLNSTVSQFGILGTVALSVLTQTSSDLEFLTWLGSRINRSPEETLQLIGNIGAGFSLKDIAQFGVIILQVLMELGDQRSTTILRAIAGSIVIFSLAGAMTGYVTGKIDKAKNNKLMPIIGIGSFFSAIRLISYSLNFITSGLALLHQSYDLHYGARAPEEILMDPILCGVRPEECKSAALNTFSLPTGASSCDIKNAYKKMIHACHPDLSTGDTDCLLKARTAKGVLI